MRYLFILMSTLIIFNSCKDNDSILPKGIGEGSFTLNGITYKVNNAHFEVGGSEANGGPYVTIHLSDGINSGFEYYSKETNHVVWITLVPEGDPSTIPAGEYSFPQINKSKNSWRIVGGSTAMTLYDEYQEYSYPSEGSLFYADFYDTGLSGSVIVKKDGAEFEINFDMPKLRTGQSLKGNYKGKIERSLLQPE